MNKCAIQHIVDSSYCFPVSENEIVLRLRTAKGDIVRAQVLYESKYVIGEKQKTAEMTKAYVGEIFDYYEIKLKLEDTRLAYVFYVNDGERSCYFSEDGLTETYDFSVGFYNFFQYPYINEKDIMRCVPWTKSAVFYQIFVDRFARGDYQKDESYINMTWGDVPNPKSFAGGDLRGIIEKLDYIQELGCNAIYLTPVFESISNHKYDISDYYQVDKQFGSNADLRELIEKAHKKGMRIVLDAVFNHCSENLAQFQDVVKLGEKSKYYNWFIIRGTEISEKKDNYETFASCSYMPKLNTSNTEVQAFLIGIATYYIQEYDIDGWRLDVSDEISHDFWRSFRKAVKAIKPEVLIIGENWHDASNYLRGDQYDSIMNYAFTKLCLDYFGTETKGAKEAAWKLNEILMRNTTPVNQMMLNLLDSHDTHRFFKEVGRNRRKMKAALALLYMFPGTPCIFYGTETLIYGGYDPDCRRCMNWEDTGVHGPYGDIWKLLRELAQLRRQYRIADLEVRITEENGMLCLKRGELFLWINNTPKGKETPAGEIQAYGFCIEMNGGVIIHD